MYSSIETVRKRKRTLKNSSQLASFFKNFSSLSVSTELHECNLGFKFHLKEFKLASFSRQVMNSQGS